MGRRYGLEDMEEQYYPPAGVSRSAPLTHLQSTVAQAAHDGHRLALLGEAQLGEGQTHAAQASFRQAIYKDSGDWSLWLDLARASTEKEQASALAHASRFDPLSPEVAEFKSELGTQSGTSITAGGNG